MTFEDVLQYYAIYDRNTIDTMYIEIPTSIDVEDMPYYNKNMENIFNKYLARKIPFMIDFCLVGADSFINDSDNEKQQSKDTFIIYKEDGTAYITSSVARLCAEDEHLLDEYNQSLIKIGKVMNAV